MARYDAVVFDLDGTLLNTLDDLADAANFALSQFGFPRRSREQVRSFVGNGVKALIDRAVPNGTEEEIAAQCLTVFKNYYAAHMTDKTAPYPGILKLLDDLHREGVKTAVVSNKFDTAVQELCQRYFPGAIDAAAGESAEIPRKPHPAMVWRVLHLLDIIPERAVYVGDADTDIETGKNAGMAGISVTWGFRDRAFLAAHGATVFADEPSDVLCRVLDG